MNNAPLNSVMLNSVQLNAVQRVAVILTAVAQIAINPRALVRGVVASSPMASIGIAGRALARAMVVVQPAAQIVITGLDRFYGKVTATAHAVASIISTVFPRRWVSHPVTVTAKAMPVVTGKILSRAPVTTNAMASISMPGKMFYSIVHGVVTVQGRASITVDFSTYKQLPFDENAPDERTMLVSQDIRLMVVL